MTFLKHYGDYEVDIVVIILRAVGDSRLHLMNIVLELLLM